MHLPTLNIAGAENNFWIHLCDTFVEDVEERPLLWELPARFREFVGLLTMLLAMKDRDIRLGSVKLPTRKEIMKSTTLSPTVRLARRR